MTQVTTTLAPRKPRTKKPASNVTPRAIRVLNKGERLQLRRELKTYQAASPERQVEIVDFARYSVATHTSTLRQQAFRVLDSEFISDTLFWAKVQRAVLASLPAAAIEPVQLVATVTLATDTPPSPELVAALTELVECAVEMVAPTSPASTMSKPKTFPFLRQYQRGGRVLLLHHLGACAVARVWPVDGSPSYLLLRYRQWYAEATTPDYLPHAFAELRALDQAENASETLQLTPAEAAARLHLAPDKWPGFLHFYGLDKRQPTYTIGQLKRALTAKRNLSTNRLLRWLRQPTPTTN